MEMTYVVQPSSQGWLIRLSGDSQSEISDSRDRAIARARQLAAQHREGRVVVLGEDGSIRAEYQASSGEKG